MTTDYRDVFGEIAARHIGVRDQPAVFPNFAATPSRWRSVMRTTWVRRTFAPVGGAGMTTSEIPVVTKISRSRRGHASITA